MENNKENELRYSDTHKQHLFDVLRIYYNIDAWDHFQFEPLVLNISFGHSIMDPFHDHEIKANPPKIHNKTRFQ